jgi:uncharacterized protein (TIGR03067 family)
LKSQLGLEGAWMPIAANVAGKSLLMRELRVKYLVLDAGGYSIIDQANHVVDSGEYNVDDAALPQTMDIVGREGPNAGRTMLAIYELDSDRLTVCYDLDGKERPPDMQPREDQVLLNITYARALSLLS